MNLQDKIIRSQLELTKPFADGTRLESARGMQDKIGKLMHFTRRRDVVVMDHPYEDVKGCLIVPRDEIRGGILLYLHGGGYTCGSIDYARGYGSVLSAECGMRVLTVEYRLAPEHPYPAALDDALEAYKYLLGKGYSPDHITLCGESSGGGLCYSLCLKLRDLGLSMPCGIIALSPWTDLTHSGPSYEANKEVDPSMTVDMLEFYANAYVGDGNRTDPQVSPLFADLRDMPPSLIFSGADEIMLSDSEYLSDRLNACGSKSRLVVSKDRWHTYAVHTH